MRYAASAAVDTELKSGLPPASAVPKVLCSTFKIVCLPASSDLIALPLLLEANHHVVLRARPRTMSLIVLDGAVVQPGLTQAPCESGRCGAAPQTAHTPACHRGNRCRSASRRASESKPAHRQQSQGKSDEVLRLPHPVNVDAREKFHSESYPPFFDTAQHPAVCAANRLTPRLKFRPCIARALECSLSTIRCRAKYCQAASSATKIAQMLSLRLARPCATGANRKSPAKRKSK